MHFAPTTKVFIAENMHFTVVYSEPKIITDFNTITTIVAICFEALALAEVEILLFLCYCVIINQRSQNFLSRCFGIACSIDFEVFIRIEH